MRTDEPADSLPQKDRPLGAPAGARGASSPIGRNRALAPPPLASDRGSGRRARSSRRRRMAKALSVCDRARRPANDNARPKRRIQTDFPAEFPVTETELEIVETYFSAIIAELAAEPGLCAANDNEPGE